MMFMCYLSMLRGNISTYVGEQQTHTDKICFIVYYTFNYILLYFIYILVNFSNDGCKC